MVTTKILVVVSSVAVMGGPSMWAGNLTHNSVSFRFFEGAHNIIISSAPECSAVLVHSFIDDGSEDFCPMSVSPCAYRSTSDRWMLRLEDLPSGCTLKLSGDVNGQIRTLFPPDDDSHDAVFTFGACDRFDTKGKNMVVFREMEKIQPDIFVHLGDLHYRDIQDDHPSVFLKAFDEVLSFEPRQHLLRTTPMDYVWNDHDYGNNDANAGNVVKHSARAAYRSMVPHYALHNTSTGQEGAIYHAFTVHKVRVVVLDVNFDWTPNVRLISEEQLQWAMEEVRNASQYRLLILISGVAFGGPSKGQWGAPGSQRDRLLEAAQGQTNIMVVSGDAHVLAYDDGRYHANIPQLAAGPLGNIGSEKGASFSGGGGGSANCMAYRLIPNQQFGSVHVSTVDNKTSVIIRGYRINPDDSLQRVFDVHRTLPFSPVLTAAQFNSWDAAEGDCSLRLMPSADSAAWIMSSMTIWFSLLVGVHLLRDGRLVLRNVVSPRKMQVKAIVFWLVIQFSLSIIMPVLIGLLIIGFIDPSINPFGTRSGLGYSILFMTLTLVGVVGIMLLLERTGKKQCSNHLFLTKADSSSDSMKMNSL